MIGGTIRRLNKCPGVKGSTADVRINVWYTVSLIFIHIFVNPLGLMRIKDSIEGSMNQKVCGPYSRARIGHRQQSQ